MLYLEDYLEMIEHLPQELRDRFTEMREMDCSVQNSMDSLEKRVKIFFTNAKKMKQTEKDAEFESIRQAYYKTLEDADVKVLIANQMYDLVERYLRHLDQELHKFKMELEANNEGITDILQKRSMELDQPQPNSNQKENRFNFNSTRASHHEKRRDSTSSTGTEKCLAVEKPSVSVPEPRPTPATVTSGSAVNPSPLSPVATPSPNVNYNLAHIGAGGNAIAAAASQAIAATQQMQQGRRTASLKASYEAINIGAHAEFSIGKELAGAAQTAIAAIQETTKKQKSRKATAAASAAAAAAAVASVSVPSTASSTSASVAPSVPSPPPTSDADDNSNLDSVDTNADNPDWTYDPNEPRYCICNQVSYGYMVACDNEDCPFEWFHYACVDIKAPPKGKWYCPQCTASMKRRGSRKN